MALDPRQAKAGLGARTQTAAVDAGLRAYMLKVYNYMGLGLLLTAAVAFYISTSETLINAIYGTMLHWVVIFAPLGMVFLLSARVHKMSAGAAQACFWIFAALMGASISWIFMAYTGESIFSVFLYTAAGFGSLSLFGYTTKKDLGPIGAFCIMGLIGILVAMIVNIFVGSSGMAWIISVLGVLIFAGLTAYDTQKIKEMYHAADGQAVMTKKAIMGALRLYLDFINMFMFMLHLFGSRD